MALPDGAAYAKVVAQELAQRLAEKHSPAIGPELRTHSSSVERLHRKAPAKPILNFPVKFAAPVASKSPSPTATTTTKAATPSSLTSPTTHTQATTTTPSGTSTTPTTPSGTSTTPTTSTGTSTSGSTGSTGSTGSSGSSGSSGSTNSDPTPVGVAGNWNMVFDDEFNSTSIDTSVWNTRNGWTDQNNVTSYASNVTEAGGDAILTLASDTSGAEMSTSNFSLAVGEYAEARIDFAGSGTTVDDWPAWWISGPNWPAAGENDIAEGLGTLTVNYHSPSGAHNEGTVPGTWTGGFHTYGIYRGSNYCDVYWDGQLVKSYATDDNGQPESLIFTIGAANTLAFGAQGQMLIDYVRAWAPAS